METENYEATPGCWSKRALITLPVKAITVITPPPVEGVSLNWPSLKHFDIFWNYFPYIQTRYQLSG